jgi:hypothetical protein
MEAHKAAHVFPALGHSEYQALKADIKSHGLRVPIVLWRGQVIDGSHRLKACQELGIEPVYQCVDMPEDKVYRYVYSLNAARRHMTSDQLAMVAAVLSKDSPEGRPVGVKETSPNEPVNSGILPSGAHGASVQEKPIDGALLFHDERKNLIPPSRKSLQAVRTPLSQGEAAGLVGVSRSRTKRALEVLRKDEGLAAKVHDGSMKLSSAIKRVRDGEHRAGQFVPVVHDGENELFQNATGHTLEEARKLLAGLKARVKQGLPTVPNEESWNLYKTLIELLGEISDEAERYKSQSPGAGELVPEVRGVYGEDSRRPTGKWGKFRRV